MGPAGRTREHWVETSTTVFPQKLTTAVVFEIVEVLYFSQLRKILIVNFFMTL